MLQLNNFRYRQYETLDCTGTLLIFLTCYMCRIKGTFEPTFQKNPIDKQIASFLSTSSAYKIWEDHENYSKSCAHRSMSSILTTGRTQCRELPLCVGSREGCQWQALPSPVQCEETVTRTRDLPVTGGKTLPLAPGPPFTISSPLLYIFYFLLIPTFSELVIIRLNEII